MNHSDIQSSEKEILFNFFNQVHSISSKNFEPIANICKKRTYKKNEIILDFGQIETKTSLVLKGVVHQYVIVDDNLCTIDFSLAGMSYNCFTSYVENTPSNQIQEALTDVEIIFIEKSDAERLLLENHDFCYIYTKLYEQVHLEREKRSLVLQHKNAYKKFELFLLSIAKSEDFLKEVPQKLIANYLSITPETYSRVKKKYLKKT
ncbi:Crp/Fnr family transcriptional regulator [Flavobacterium hydrophilum]|uniref:Crp/Fnr family transcriptional regulator n=1 Tax=Flavobacterium hydrophilum TaxID=2211445 RepID=A0A2V4BXX2_9FLAO|nr:Crp/Fnr family transcriptional regulator [Flavobacterium hydrophilum]PXY43855.1 Crp/Fnr family transcriptional regulator [Flavobacterium hydrophilum]